MPVMVKATKSHSMRFTTLLLLTSLLGSAIHTAAQGTGNDVPPPENSPPPVDDSSPPEEVPSGIDISGFKEAKLSDIGNYDDVIWTDITPDSHSTCRLKGYYDEKVLNTKALQISCFSLISSIINNEYALGAEYLTNTYYYPSDSYPYCAVACQDGDGSSAVFSKQLSFLSAAFAVFSFLALNHL